MIADVIVTVIATVLLLLLVISIVKYRDFDDPLI